MPSAICIRGALLSDMRELGVMGLGKRMVWQVVGIHPLDACGESALGRDELLYCQQGPVEWNEEGKRPQVAMRRAIELFEAAHITL